MNLVKTSLLNGIAVLIKLTSTIFLNKVLAIHVGPTGYAVIGQFQNLISVVTTFASGAISTGVTKYTAEHHDDPQRQAAVWRTALGVSMIGAAVFASALILLRQPLARWALSDASLSGVMVWLAAALVLLVVNGLMLAILSGLKAVRAYVLANIVGSLVTVLTATILVLQFGLYGALVALAISQAMSCVATAWLFARRSPIPLRALFGRIDPCTARRLGAYALMGVTMAVVGPTGQVIIRDGLVSRLGWNDAGLWQALWKISETHLMLLTTTLSLYFLPRFSEIRDGATLRAEVLNGYRFVLPLVLTSSAVIFVLRETLVRALFTPEFLPLVEAMGLQLVGDVLKICSWVMAFTLLSHKRTRTFIVTEIAFMALFVGSSLVLAEHYGLRGTAAAYALTFALYGLTMFVLFMRLTSELGPGPVRPASTL